MKKLLTYLLSLLIGCCVYAQPSDWVNIATRDSAVFSFQPYSIQANGSAILPYIGDAIGIFSLKSTGKYECVGFSRYTNDTVIQALTVVAHGDNGKGYGFEANMPFYMLYYSATSMCYYFLQPTSFFDSTLFTGQMRSIDSAYASTFSVTYPKSEYWHTEQSTAPSIVPMAIPVQYSSMGGKLAIDSIGQINIANSDTGTYTITLASQGCLVAISLQLVIKDSVSKDTSTRSADTLDISHLTYSVLNPTCVQAGELVINLSSIKGKRPFLFHLLHVSSNQRYTNSNGLFNGLAEGTYRLEVTDSTNALAAYPAPIVLIKEGNCQNSVISPDRQGNQTIHIADQGTAKILDREGKTVKDLTIPNDWDGVDNNGKQVPMGDYYLFVNGQQSQIITVIR